MHAFTHRQIWFLYQNLYKEMLSDLSPEDIEKLKKFYVEQVSKYNTMSPGASHAKF